MATQLKYWHRLRLGFLALSGWLLVATLALTAAPAPPDRDPRSPEEVQEAKDDLRHLQSLAEARQADLNELWRAWQAFCLRHAGTPEWSRAAEIMAKVPSPLDALDRNKIPKEDRPAWLPKEVVAVLGELRARHARVYQVDMSTDGRLIASNAWKDIRLWDADTMRERYRLNDAPRMALFPDGKTIAAGGGEDDAGAVHLWDIGGDKPRERLVLPNTENCIDFLGVSEDQKTLLTIEWSNKEAPRDWRKTISIWDLSGERPRRRAALKREKPRVFVGLALASQGTAFIDTDGPDETPLRVWDISKDPPKVRCFVKARRGTTDPIALSPDGKMVAVEHVQAGRGITLWDVSGNEAKGLDVFEMLDASILTFSPDGNLLVSSGWDRVLRFWPATEAGRKALGLGQGQTHAAYSLDYEPCSMAFSGDGKTLVLGGNDGIVHVWDMQRKAERFPPRGHTGLVSCLEFSPDGRTLATGAQDSTVRLWDLAGSVGKETAKLQAQTDRITALAFAPDGKKLAMAASGKYSRDIFQYEHAVRLWDLTGQSPRSICLWEPHNGDVNSLAFHPDGRLVTAGMDRMDDFSQDPHASVRFWDVSAPNPVKGVELQFRDLDKQGERVSPEGAANLAFGPRGKILVFATGWICNPTVRVFDWDGGKYKALPSFDPLLVRINALALSPDGMKLAMAGMVREGPDRFRLWRLGPTEATLLQDLQAERVTSVSFSPDGTLIAAAGAEGLFVYDMGSGKKVYSWETNDGPYDVAFAPDSRHLATGNVNGTVYIFLLPEQKAKGAP